MTNLANLRTHFKGLDEDFINRDKINDDVYAYDSSDVLVQTTFELPIIIECAGSTVHYEFTSNQGDISFGVEFQSEKGEDFGVEEPRRVNFAEQPLRGTFDVKQRGVVFFLWDNCYDWSGEKRISYVVRIEQPAFSQADKRRSSRSIAMLSRMTPILDGLHEKYRSAAESFSYNQSYLYVLNSRMNVLQQNLADRMYERSEMDAAAAMAEETIFGNEVLTTLFGIRFVHVAALSDVYVRRERSLGHHVSLFVLFSYSIVPFCPLKTYLSNRSSTVLLCIYIYIYIVIFYWLNRCLDSDTLVHLLQYMDPFVAGMVCKHWKALVEYIHSPLYGRISFSDALQQTRNELELEDMNDNESEQGGKEQDKKKDGKGEGDGTERAVGIKQLITAGVESRAKVPRKEVDAILEKLKANVSQHRFYEDDLNRIEKEITDGPALINGTRSSSTENNSHATAPADDTMNIGGELDDSSSAALVSAGATAAVEVGYIPREAKDGIDPECAAFEATGKFDELMTARVDEFLTFLCVPMLQLLPREYMDNLVDELSEILDNYVSCCCFCCCDSDAILVAKLCTLVFPEVIYQMSVM